MKLYKSVLLLLLLGKAYAITLTSGTVTATGVDLSWTTVTNTHHYNVYRGVVGGGAGSLIAQVTAPGLNYSDTSAAPTTNYNYSVIAIINGGTQTSNTVTITTLADTTPPSVPTGLASTSNTVTTVNLSWSVSTDNVGVTGYKVFRGGVQVYAGAPLSFVDIGLSPSTTYAYTVLAYDAAGNNSAQSSSVNAVTPADTSAPTMPTGLTSSGSTATAINLFWTPSTDNVAVTAYRVYRGTTVIALAANAFFTDYNLTPNTAYAYKLSAVDAATNVSSITSVLNVTTPATLPSVPATYQTLYANLQAYMNSLDANLAGWDGSKYAVNYATGFTRANANTGSGQLAGMQNNLAYVNQALDAIKALGILTVDVSINYPVLDSDFYSSNCSAPGTLQAWTDYYAAVAASIHAKGMKMMVEANTALTVNGTGSDVAVAAACYYQTLSWTQYKTRRSAANLIVAGTVQPDLLILQSEPDTDANNASRSEMSDPTQDAAMISGFVSDLEGASITGLHSTIKLGAGVGTWISNWLTYINAFAAISGIDVLDNHVYRMDGLGQFITSQKIADIAHANSKGVAMAQVWSHKGLGATDPEGDQRVRDKFSFWSPLDQQFTLSLMNMANYKHIDWLVPFNEQLFFANLDYASISCTPVYPWVTGTDNSACNATLTNAESVAFNSALTAGTTTALGDAYKADIIALTP